MVRRCASSGTARIAGIVLRERKAKLVSAEVDPDHDYLLDRDPFNNSWREKADRRASGKLAGYWTLLTQWLEQALSWLA